MKELRYTLLPDGTSDRAFLPILNWLFQNNGVKCPIQAKWAKLGSLRKPPKSLSERICTSLELYPCDLLFIHRDAEKEPRENRILEISNAVEEAQKKTSIPIVVYVIPVRMLEAWLLFDEMAIRKAAGNPSGKSLFNLPHINTLEKISDPKDELCQILRLANESTGRRLKQFKARERECIQRIADLIDDFSPLRSLSAFQALEQDIRKIIREQGWNH